MIENFLRPPRTPGEVTADLLRVVGVVGILVAGVGWSLTDAGILAFLLPGLLAPRFLGVRSGFDIVHGLVLLVAGWSNVADLYSRIGWWDVPVHIACTGVVSILAYLLLARQRFLAPPRATGIPPIVPILLTTVIGLALSAVWEMVEWFGRTVITTEIIVAYDDTIGDMAAGGLGALVGGIVVATTRLVRAPSPSSPVTTTLWSW